MFLFFIIVILDCQSKIMEIVCLVLQNKTIKNLCVRLSLHFMDVIKCSTYIIYISIFQVFCIKSNCGLYLQKKSSSHHNTPPPVTQLNKVQHQPGVPLVKKEKRQNSSRFNISRQRELTKIAALKGKDFDIYFYSLCMFCTLFVQKKCSKLFRSYDSLLPQFFNNLVIHKNILQAFK